MTKLKTLKQSDHVTMIFGEWFDRMYGNTYYDIEIKINDDTFYIASQYGYNAGDHQSVTEGLTSAGYKLRECKKDRFKPFRSIHVVKTVKLKRELFK